MAFHTDTQMPKVFTNFYFLFLGNNNYQPYLIEVPYAIGLAVGISVFFNHFSKIKYTSDPTPIEVELKIYENQVDDSIIEELNEEGDP
jgi:stage V sporulation protein AA